MPKIHSVTAAPVDFGVTLPSDVDVDTVNFSSNGLVITLSSAKERKCWELSFIDVMGHRVLDEGDLLEFWPVCSRPRGSIFQIQAGGWLAQESNREGFLLHHMQPDICEYFVNGSGACVCVLTQSAPEIKACTQG
mgnify:CR=1 FL=1